MTVLVWLVIGFFVLVAVGELVRVTWRRWRGHDLYFVDLPSLSGELTFRLPVPEDVPQLIDLAHDPATAEANGWTEDTVRQVVDTLRTPMQFALWATSALLAVRRVDGVIVGVATAAPMQPETASGVSIGLQTHPDHRGRGYGGELVTAALVFFRHAFDSELWVGTSPTNEPIRSIMRGLGYSPEPGLLTYRAPNGQVIDSLWYRCTRPPSGDRRVKRAG